MMHNRRVTSRRLKQVGTLAGAMVFGSVALAVPSAAPAGATAGGIVITEVAPWASGNSPYAADWFEVTNLGAAPVDITGWKVDDNTNAFVSSVALNGITTIGAGQSVIFMETAVPATTIPQFTSAWFGSSVPAGLQIGSYTGSGLGLGTGGDAVNLFDAAGALQAKVNK